MKIFYAFFIVTLFFGCSKEKETVVSSKNPVVTKKVSYDEFKTNLAEKDRAYKQKYFFQYINYDVPYYWKGTPWTFAGTSSEPKKGSVACGYFVTNVLKNYGFNLKAAYLAQQASSVMIKELCTDIKYFSNRNEMDKYILNTDKNQVYIVGLDFHTGFITRENKDIYFIHSNYIKNQGVVKEKTSESAALNASKTFMIGNLKL